MVRRNGYVLALVLAIGGSLVTGSVLGGCAEEEPSFRPMRAHAEGRAPAAPVEERPAARAAEIIPAQAPAAAPEIVPVQEIDQRLLNPAAARERAPELFVVELDTTEGPVQIEVHRAWSPNGADRFYNLVRIGYFQDVAFFRVVPGFMAQGGIHGSGQVNAAWQRASIQDDPVVEHNTRGMVTFAMSGAPNSRSNQFFINLVDNERLDPMGFAPFGRVRAADMAIVDRLYSGYGEGAPGGRGPAQARIQSEGNAYLRAQFPELDYIRSARIVSPAPAGGR